MDQHKETLAEAMRKALASKRYMVAVWHVDEEGKLWLYLKTEKFLVNDFEVAMKLLEQELLKKED